MRRAALRTTHLFAGVCIAALVVGGIVIMQVLTASLRETGLTADAVTTVYRTVLGTIIALGVVLLGVAIVAGRAYARALRLLRQMVLARARGDIASKPEFSVAELIDVASAVERLSAYVSSREARTAREGAEVSVLLDAISEGILQIDSGGRIVRANPAARALLGLSPRAVGQPIATYIRHAELRRLIERAVAGDVTRAAEIALEDQRVIVSARPLAATGDRSAGTVVAFVDLTEVRRLESVRRDFVANVSHELKTPLTSIRGYAETLLSDADLPAEVRRQFIEIVHKNADRLHHIVDDLLDLSRLESGGWRPELHEVNARDVIEDVWSACAVRARAKRITFTPPVESPVVLADPGGLRQVLSNLFENALRYTPDGGRIEVRAGAEEMQPPADAPLAAKRYIVFEVRDTGAGIPSDALPRIFERFYRADPARSRAEGGTGLGLSIVRHLVERMGGDVAAESTLGKGTIIRFRLPAA